MTIIRYKFYQSIKHGTFREFLEWSKNKAILNVNQSNNRHAFCE